MTRAEVIAAYATARNLLTFRGWAPGHCYIPRVGDNLGARATHGPICLISALADCPGPVFRVAYLGLRAVTGAESLTVWEGAPGRTLADVLGAIEAATQRLHNV